MAATTVRIKIQWDSYNHPTDSYLEAEVDDSEYIDIIVDGGRKIRVFARDVERVVEVHKLMRGDT